MNFLQRLRQSVWPTPRQPVTWRRALPLIVFLALFAGLCLFLEFSHTLLFARPGMFVLMAVAIWVWWMHAAGYSGLSRGRALTALLVRLGLIGAFVMVLAEPRAVRSRDVVSVIYAVDTSDSIAEEMRNDFIQSAVELDLEKPASDESGLIFFGGNAAVEFPSRSWRPSIPFEAINVRVERDATNLEEALSLAAAMLPEENMGRIVLFSDGTATEGNLSSVLEELKSREIAVDVRPIWYEYDNEVWVERLDLPRFVKLGENYEASMIVSSLKPGNGRLVLRENGEVISDTEIDFAAGKNRYRVPIYLRTPGYYEYSATIEVAEAHDHLRQNNTVLNYIYVEGEGRVLVVTDPQGDERDSQKLVQALQEGKRDVEVISSYEFPSDSHSLLPHDLVVWVNVPRDAFDVMQLEALRDAVYDLGTGFVMVGGKNSFGPGGYHRTVIEQALPVTMDVSKKKILPKGALAIVLHTCEFPEGNTWGKRITIEAIKVLSEQDEVGVLVYGAGGEQWLFQLTPVSDFQNMVQKINAAQIGDMPSFVTTMQMGFNALKNSDASAKHMIIISDGDPQPPPPPLLTQFSNSKISVSTVAVFPHGTGAELNTMRSIANITKGRFYHPQDPNLLPAIFIKESKTLRRNMIHDKTITPEFGFPSPILKGINALPPLHAYVLTSIKGRAKSILNAPPQEDEVDPILATWRYGLGTTAAFTSDLSSNWGADWVEWDKYRAFVEQLTTDVARIRSENHLRLWTDTSGSRAVLFVEDHHPQDMFLEVRARISGPQDKSETIALRQVGPRRYQAVLPLWGRGRYQVMAVGKAGDREERAHGGFIVPYSPEYLRFRANPIVLQEIAEKTGGRVLTDESTAEEIYLTRRKPKRSSRPVFDWFLIALACLLPLDVAVRRVQLDLYMIKRWLGLGAPAGPSTATMGTLLKRKQAVASTFESRKEEKPLEAAAAPLPTATAAAPAREPSKPKPQKAPEPPAEPKREEDATSTTGRLLAMKRKRDQGQE